MAETKLDVIIVCPCGLNLEQTEKAVEEELQPKFVGEWKDVDAVKNNRVFLVDGEPEPAANLNFILM